MTRNANRPRRLPTDIEDWWPGDVMITGQVVSQEDAIEHASRWSQYRRVRDHSDSFYIPTTTGI